MTVTTTETLTDNPERGVNVNAPPSRPLARDHQT